MTATIGFPFVPSLPPERLPGIARAVDEHLDELWVWEDCFAESGLATAVAALAMTNRMSVRLGLMPTPLRNVAITAMEVATIARLYPGALPARDWARHPGMDGPGRCPPGFPADPAP